MRHGDPPPRPWRLRRGSLRTELRRASGKLLGAAGLLLMAILFLNPAWAQPPRKTEVFFAQGQAIYYPEDKARSQSEATRDLMSSGVLQAVAGVLGPAGTQSMFGQVQEKVLANQERYVDGYQLASEGLANGLYRVTGQVTVSRELLIQDMRDFGFQVPPGPPPRVAELVQGKPTLIPPGPAQNLQAGRPGRGPGPTRPMIVWAVAENWESKWVLPDDVTGGGLPPFARGILERARGVGWTPRFVPAPSFQVDREGNLKVEEVLAVSRQAGLEKAVIGRAWLDASQPGNERVLASLETLDVASGGSEAEVGGERALEGGAVEEAILHLVESVMPSLDRALSAREGAREHDAAAEAVRGPETWTLTINASHPQSAWEIVRKEIEALFKDARTTGFEMGANRITVQIEGVEGRSLRDALDGMEVSPDIPAIRIDEFSEDGRSMAMGFGTSGEPR